MIELPKSVTCTDLSPGYPILDVNHPSATARIALNGGHVMEWTPKGESPVLFMSADAVFEVGKPIRGGIPICWPWFGPHPTLSDAPAHGFVRTRVWDLAAVEELSSGVQLTLSLDGQGENEPQWPHDFSLRLVVWIGAEFEAKLVIQNTGNVEWSMSGALHTYFNVTDVTQIQIRGLHGTHFVEGRLSPEKRLQSGDVVINREVDRLYASDAAVEIVDPKGARTLIVEKEGSRSTVVWNPWIEKSKRLGDLPDDAYPGFLCVESTNAGDDIVTIPAGGEHALITRLRVRKLKERD
jgi:glucose-6-phosphate 1-epimerase